MATGDKDFKVKNGIQVTGNGTFGGTIAAAAPTLPEHLTTREYVDSVVSSAGASLVVGGTAPENPSDGDLWFDTLIERINVYYGTQWVTIATIDDTLTIPDHIHDTSIDGNGLIVTTFIDAGSFNQPQGTPIDGASPDTIDWADTYNGGIAIDNFN